jgi:hypothetical protein
LDIRSRVASISARCYPLPSWLCPPDPLAVGSVPGAA